MHRAHQRRAVARLRAPEDPPADASRYDVQILLQSDRVTFRGDPRFTDQSEHVVVRVLTENGRKIASQTSSWDAEAELLSIAGRVLSPTGAVTPLDRSQVFFTGDPNQHGRARLSFQLPNVQVGSLVEWSFVISTPRLIPTIAREVAAPVPVEHYKLQLDVHTTLDYAFRTYFSHQPVGESNSIAYHHLTWNLDHLMPAPEEQYAWSPDPRWVYRNTDYRSGPVHVTLIHGWEDVYKEALTRLALPDYTQGFVPPKLDLSSCRDRVSCRVRAAWAEVHQLTDTTEVGSLNNARPLAAVLASHTATRHEQALLFQALARSVGLEADLVFIGMPSQHGFDRNFPSGLHDDVVTWVRPAGDLPTGLFVDASCEVCEPGVVRDTAQAAEGVRAWVVAHDADHVESFGVLTTVAGESVPSSESDDLCDVTVEENGDLTVVERAFTIGSIAAEARRANTRKGGFSGDAAEKAIRHRYPQAKLVAFERFTCDKERHTCSEGFKYVVPGGANLVDGHLLVPLKMMSTVMSEVFLQPERVMPLTIDHHDKRTSMVKLRVPAGWKATEGPGAYDESGAGFTTHIESGQVGQTWLLSRTLTIVPGRWPETTYPKAREVVRKFADLRDQSIVLAKD
ncbi:MAG: DUF3857 domain-containing protein [Myxococcaceae bacterium]